MVCVSTVADPPRTVAGCLRSAMRALEGCSDSPRLDAEVLLAHLLAASRSALHVRADEPLRADTLQSYRELTARRAAGVPVAYLTGVREFWSLPLKVTPAVLVPRPETELLVEQALALLPAQCGGRSVLDLGTGSGAIALAVALERPLARIVGVDLSHAALGVARDNARALSLERIEWRAGSWFEVLGGERFDLVVSNPPYIAEGDPALEALAAEPAAALIAGPSGMEMLACIIAAAPRHLVAGGWLVLEHGATQAVAVARLLREQGFAELRSLEDYSGRSRLTRGRLLRPPAAVASINQEPS
jgi:release factor glutamine methyltransferase